MHAGKRKRRYGYDSDEAVGYEDDDNKSAVNEEYPIDTVVGFSVMLRFEEVYFLLSTSY